MGSISQRITKMPLSYNLLTQENLQGAALKISFFWTGTLTTVTNLNFNIKISFRFFFQYVLCELFQDYRSTEKMG